jgi:hypothetical protein
LWHVVPVVVFACQTITEREARFQWKYAAGRWSVGSGWALERGERLSVERGERLSVERGERRSVVRGIPGRGATQ